MNQDVTEWLIIKSVSETFGNQLFLLFYFIQIYTTFSRTYCIADGDRPYLIASGQDKSPLSTFQPQNIKQVTALSSEILGETESHEKRTVNS